MTALEPTFAEKLRSALNKTRSSLVDRVTMAFRTGSALDEASLESIEEALLLADAGVTISGRLIKGLRGRKIPPGGNAVSTVLALLREEMGDVLMGSQQQFGDTSLPEGPRPHVIMVVGVNGAGKTTTVGKLAHHFTKQGLRVVIGSGDTFRAAAHQQLRTWAERAGAEIIGHGGGSPDPASVAFDAVSAALARKADVVLLDTAGRLHNKTHLMEELRKIHRVVGKRLEGAPHETLLVLDATTGQNGLQQARQFSEVTPLTGVILTKLDGTAKGGVVLGIAGEHHLPIRFVGVGEGVEDLQPFEPGSFIRALLPDGTEQPQEHS